ncbi:GIY-YIG nuclease family protein [Patescibacteria group bacterium]|nr:GIY-YIG nuclease family protein [Patescibacteria group bacterium]
MYFVYILECEDGSFYTGSSPNPEERFKRHKAGTGSRYTRMHRPVRIIYTEKLNDKSQALKREVQIKSWSRKKKEALISRD